MDNLGITINQEGIKKLKFDIRKKEEGKEFTPRTKINNETSQGSEQDQLNYEIREGEEPPHKPMRISTWNARGLNASSKKHLLKRNLNTFESNINLI